ncbi:MAG: fused MFS/spermidine synthase [Verrucomicrobiae bacterium]|nr:fused MFS/spermidine synthase [Verrucomicrobiae bacterium]
MRYISGASADDPARLQTLVQLAIAAIGAACTMTQLAFMRETLSAFGGNEMVFGVVLGLWLLLMGFGTTIGRAAAKATKPATQLLLGQVMVAIVPMCQVLALRMLRDLVFVRGSDVGLTGTIACAGVLLLPFCVVAGYTLVLASSILSRADDPLGAGRVYVADSIGCIAGGILFSFLLVRWLDHIALLGVSAVLNLGVATCIASQPVLFATQGGSSGNAHQRTSLIFLPAAGLGLVVVFLAFDPDTFSTRAQFTGQRLLFKANSPYGRLVVTEASGQTNFIENGAVLVYTPNIEQVEEAVHYAMCQRMRAQRVLLVSGSATGAAREILKYGVAQVDCVELDPLIVEATRRFLPEHVADRRIRLFTTDARRFVRQTTNRYEVVILALPDPDTAQLNRLYTAEFFSELKRVLEPDGVVSFAIGRYENYVSRELAQMLSSAYRTVSASFRSVLVLPGGRVYFLASDGPLERDIAGEIEHAGIPTKLVNRNYLGAVLSPDRFADVQRAISHAAALNRDFSPVLYYYALRHWASQFESGLGPVQFVLLAVLVLYALRLRRGAMVLFASGFAGSALEVVLLLAFQVLCGSVYYQVGVIVTLFMVGLAVGAAMSNRYCVSLGPSANAPPPSRAQLSEPWASARKRLVVLALSICAVGSLLPLGLNTLASAARTGVGELLVHGSIGLATFALGWLVGAQFPLASWLESGRTDAASKLFTADFVGAFLGALLASTFLVPALGVATTCLAAAGLNLAAAVGLGVARRTN